MDEATLDVLLNAASAAEALHSLYALQKAKNPKRSMAYLCRKAGVSSTGYLADVMSGRRYLHPRYRDGVVKAFGLKDTAAWCLKLLIDIDNDKGGDKTTALRRRLKLQRKVLHTAYRSTSELQGLFSALEVFCAFGLFQNAPTRQQLLTYFGVARQAEVEASLKVLLDLALIRAGAGDAYQLLVEQVVFGADGIRLSHIEFLKLAMSHASANFETWFANKQMASFTSAFISVNAADYMRKLPALNQKIKVAQSNLESGAADMLIRFNFQIYPVGSPEQVGGSGELKQKKARRL